MAAAVAIGNSSNLFIATFDSNGYTISNLFISCGSDPYVGLFGYAIPPGVTRNTGLLSVKVTGGHYVGGLVGQGCGAITASFASGSVRGTGDYVGGLVGRNDGGQIKDSYFSGSVSGTEDDVGGLVGASWSNATITTSYASSSVTGDNYVGGLVGDNLDSTTASYSSGFVIGTEDYVGAMVGSSRLGTIEVSYWDTETSGQTISDAGLGKTAAELQSPTGYTGIYASWNVDTTMFEVMNCPTG